MDLNEGLTMSYSTHKPVLKFFDSEKICWGEPSLKQWIDNLRKMESLN